MLPRLARSLSRAAFSSAAVAAPVRAPSALVAALARGGDAVLLSPRALARLTELRARAATDGRADADSLALRVRVDSGGCSGLRYEFAVEAGGARADDAAFGRVDAYALVDDVSLAHLRGATIEWEESLVRSAFVVSTNPNADAACGCKMSFSPKS
jgi:iron-sulfur cluster assembly accessory protein